MIGATTMFRYLLAMVVGQSKRPTSKWRNVASNEVFPASDFP